MTAELKKTRETSLSHHLFKVYFAVMTINETCQTSSIQFGGVGVRRKKGNAVTE